MSLATERQRSREHAEWVSYKKRINPEGVEPPPGYKDCRNCTLRRDFDTLEERTAFCATDCPFADLPIAPSHQFLQATIWALLPEAFVVQYADELGWPMVLGIQMLRESREAEKLSAMMGVRLLG